MVDTPQSISAEMLSQSLKEGQKQASKDGSHDKDRKFLGVIPAGSVAVRGILYGMWLAGVESKSGKVQRFVEAKVAPVSNKLFKDSARAAGVSKIIAVGSTIGIAAIPFIGDIFSGTSKHKKDRDHMAAKIRPLLEEVTGKTGTHALMNVKHSDNEVLFVQRKRFEADMGQRVKDDVVMLSLSSAPTALTSVVRASGGSVNKSLGKIFSSHADETVAAASEVAKSAGGTIAKDSNSFSSFVSLLAPQLGELFNEESKRNYKANRQPYSALEMIVSLDQQLRDIDFEDKHYRDSFSLPSKGGSKPLMNYIAEVFKQHQRDMEKIDPEYSTLRTALDPKLEEISKDIAEAIKRGDIAPMSLARLAGECQVIKGKGRSLAKPSEVRSAIQKMSGSALNYLQVDSAEYYGESSFSRRDLKEALGALKGDDKVIFASLIPDDILRESGIGSEQIQQIRDMSSQVYERKLAQVVTGLAGYDDSKLAGLGLAEEEISQLRDVAKHVKDRGEESIHEFRAKPTDPSGIERVVTNAVVNRVQGDREYLGKLLNKGQELMSAAPQEVLEDAAENASATEDKAGNFTNREASRRDESEALEAEAQLAV